MQKSPYFKLVFLNFFNKSNSIKATTRGVEWNEWSIKGVKSKTYFFGTTKVLSIALKLQ
jgi:hypothetical protein